VEDGEDSDTYHLGAESDAPINKLLTIRLDADVLAWLKSRGCGYQTRINKLLRVAMAGRRSPTQLIWELGKSKGPGSEDPGYSKPRGTAGS
jgi:hypothetical protein